MGGFDILILAAVAFAVFSALRRMKRNGICGGDCRNCKKCRH